MNQDIEIYDEKRNRFRRLFYYDRKYLKEIITTNEKNAHVQLGHFKWIDGFNHVDYSIKLDDYTQNDCYELALELFMQYNSNCEINYMKVYYNPLNINIKVIS